MSEQRGETNGSHTTGAPPPWVVVAGGFHARGGMDRANAALAHHLVARGHALHLVAHSVEPALAAHTSVTVHLAPRPAGSILLGEHLLARRGREVARSLTQQRAGARVVVNGGNCSWPDVNWVHSVHHAWPTSDAGAPLWFKAKNRLSHALARRGERRALDVARLVLANSDGTRRHLIELLGVKPEIVRTVYLGSDAGCRPATVEERSAACLRLGLTDARPVVAFVGALGHDNNKGFDTLWLAWKSLCAREDWDADLIVAGGGRGVRSWRERVAAEGLTGRVRLLGFTEKVEEVLAASDLLVSPARYEAYGLNAHEAISRGVPALVSASAGIAERFTPSLREMLLPDAEDATDLATRLLRWRFDVDGWKTLFAPLASKLRRRTWDDMAADIVALVEGKAESQLRSAECGVPIDENDALYNPHSAIRTPHSL